MIRCSRFEKIGIRIKIKYENISWVAKTKQTKRIPNFGVSTKSHFAVKICTASYV